MAKTLGDITSELTQNVLDPAKAEAGRIRQDAQEQADHIIADARKEAQKILEQAKSEVEHLKRQMDTDMETPAVISSSCLKNDWKARSSIPSSKTRSSRFSKIAPFWRK